MALKQLFKQPLTEVSTTLKDVLGDIRMESGKLYKYVKFLNVTATVAAVAGDPLSYRVTDGYSGNIVVADNTDAAAQPVCAGFAMGTITGTAGTAYYIWVQLTGTVTVPTAVTSGVLGSGAMCAAGDKTLTVTTGVIAPVCTLMTATAANNVVFAQVPW